MAEEITSNSESIEEQHDQLPADGVVSISDLVDEAMQRAFGGESEIITDKQYLELVDHLWKMLLRIEKIAQSLCLNPDYLSPSDVNIASIAQQLRILWVEYSKMKERGLEPKLAFAPIGLRTDEWLAIAEQLRTDESEAIKNKLRMAEKHRVTYIADERTGIKTHPQDPKAILWRVFLFDSKSKPQALDESLQPSEEGNNNQVGTLSRCDMTLDYYLALAILYCSNVGVGLTVRLEGDTYARRLADDDTIHVTDKPVGGSVGRYQCITARLS